MFSLAARQEKVEWLNRPVGAFCLGALLVGSVESVWRSYVAPHPHDKFTGSLGLLMGLYFLMIGAALASALFGSHTGHRRFRMRKCAACANLCADWKIRENRRFRPRAKLRA